MNQGLEDWFSPSQIIYHPRQMIWALQHYLELSHGQWPVEPDEYLGCIIIKNPQYRNDLYFFKKYKSSYIEAPLSSAHRFTKAYFEEPVDLAAELMSRLDRCEPDISLVKLFYIYDVPFDKLAITARMAEEEVNYRINRVIKYISGWRRKARTYKEWYQHKRGLKPTFAPFANVL